MREPVAEGPCQGELIERPRFEKFLDDYYALHGWDANGHPTPETVQRLGISST